MVSIRARCQENGKFVLVKGCFIARRRASHEPPSVFLLHERHVLERARGVRPGEREISECAVVERADNLFVVFADAALPVTFLAYDWRLNDAGAQQP